MAAWTKIVRAAVVESSSIFNIEAILFADRLNVEFREKVLFSCEHLEEWHCHSQRWVRLRAEWLWSKRRFGFWFWPPWRCLSHPIIYVGMYMSLEFREETQDWDLYLEVVNIAWDEITWEVSLERREEVWDWVLKATNPGDWGQMRPLSRTEPRGE